MGTAEDSSDALELRRELISRVLRMDGVDLTIPDEVKRNLERSSAELSALIRKAESSDATSATDGSSGLHFWRSDFGAGKCI